MPCKEASVKNKGRTDEMDLGIRACDCLMTGFKNGRHVIARWGHLDALFLQPLTYGAAFKGRLLNRLFPTYDVNLTPSATHMSYLPPRRRT